MLRKKKTTKKVYAKRLLRTHKVIDGKGKACPVIDVGRVTNRRVTPHEEMIEICYMSGPKGDVVIAALFSLKTLVEVQA